jgi:DHA1 family inner membrane transport protein
VSILNLSNAAGVFVGGMLFDSSFGLRALPLVSTLITAIGITFILYINYGDQKVKKIISDS